MACGCSPSPVLNPQTDTSSCRAHRRPGPVALEERLRRYSRVVTSLSMVAVQHSLRSLEELRHQLPRTLLIPRDRAGGRLSCGRARQGRAPVIMEQGPDKAPTVHERGVRAWSTHAYERPRRRGEPHPAQGGATPSLARLNRRIMRRPPNTTPRDWTVRATAASPRQLVQECLGRYPRFPDQVHRIPGPERLQQF